MNIKIHTEIKATPEIDWSKPGQLFKALTGNTIVITSGNHDRNYFSGTSLDGRFSGTWIKESFSLYPHPVTISNFPIPEGIINLKK